MGFMKEEIITNWEDLRHIIDGHISDDDAYYKSWVFRGQADAKWRLSTGLERFDLVREESKMIEDFQRHAHLYTNTEKIDNTLEWLSMMQHYGAPTRLLDWTRSPYVAIFFAINDVNIDIYSTKERYCAVYALNYHPIKLALKEKYEDHGKYNFLAKDFMFNNRLTELQFEQLYFSERSDYASDSDLPPIVLPLVPFNSHVRLTIQQGLFLIPTQIVTRTFEENLESTFEKIPDSDKWLKKYLIPVELKPKIITELNHMNINDATLFPGIEGYSKFLKKQYSLDNERHKAYVIKHKKS